VICLEAGSRLTFGGHPKRPAADEREDGLDRQAHRDRSSGLQRRWVEPRCAGPAWAPRFQEHEFKPRTTYGLLPDTSLIDWPLTLEELAPYYDKAELRMGVTGTHGIPPFFGRAFIRS